MAPPDDQEKDVSFSKGKDRAGISKRAIIFLIIAISISALALIISVLALSRVTKNNLRPHIHLTADASLVGQCPQHVRSEHLPCFKGPNEYMCREGNYQPLKCVDDFFEDEGRGSNSCNHFHDVFHLSRSSNTLKIKKSGLYRFYGQVSYKDKHSHQSPVKAAIRINNRNWIQCYQQNTLSTSGSVQYTTCVLGGQRRLSSGDRVALHLGDSHRRLNSYRKMTFWGLVFISD